MHLRRAHLLLLAGLIALLTGAAFSMPGAHAAAPLQVIRTTPADGATLNAAPPEIVLDFADILPDIDAIIQLQNANKELLRTGQPIAFNNRTSLKVRVLEKTGLPAGVYTVTWLVRPKQAEPVSGKFTFTLEAPEGSTTGTDVTDSTVPVEIETGGLKLAKSSHSTGFWGFLGRMLGYIGLAGLAGALLLIMLVWQEGVEYVLTVRHLVLFWALGAFGDLLLVACVASDAGGTSLARGMLPNNWGDALHTSYGKAVVIRFLAMAVSLWVARRPERVIDTHSRLLAVGGPALALITYGWSRHPESVVSVPFGILHMVAVSAWLGGVLLLVRVVLAGPGEADLATAVKKFRGIAMPALVLVVLTGLIEAAIRLGGGRNLLNTGFGKILVLKILAVAAMGFIGTANRAFVRARMGRSQTLAVRPAIRLRKSMRTEVMVGVFVLVLSGWLIGAKAPNGQSADPGAVNRVVLTSDDGSFKAAVTFGPKKVGALVEVHFELLKPKSIENGLITLTPNDVNVESFEIPIEGSPKYGFGPEQGFTFPASGTWTMTITGQGPAGELPAIAYQFVVRNQDGSEPSPLVTTPETPTTRETVPDTTEPVTTATPSKKGN